MSLPPNEFELRGRLLPAPLADRLQRCFVERFAPEVLPRLSPPYWGRAFEEARLVDVQALRSPAFLARRPMLCLLGRPAPRPSPKYLRRVLACRPTDLSRTLTSLHWSVRCDFYLFDAGFTWFIAALQERIHQMRDDGGFPLLVHGDPGAGWDDADRGDRPQP